MFQYVMLKEAKQIVKQCLLIGRRNEHWPTKKIAVFLVGTIFFCIFSIVHKNEIVKREFFNLVFFLSFIYRFYDIFSI